jgi:hypothetical protein
MRTGGSLFAHPDTSGTCGCLEVDGLSDHPATIISDQCSFLNGSIRIARLNPDGTLDATFKPEVNGTVFSIAEQADGKIVVGGAFTQLGWQTRNRIARLNADGSLLCTTGEQRCPRDYDASRRQGADRRRLHTDRGATSWALEGAC